MTTSTAPVKVPCPKVVKPTADDLEKIIIFIGNQYGWEYIKPLEELLGAFPLSHSWDGITSVSYTHLTLPTIYSV